jgi:ribosomal protein S27AE
MAEDSEESDDSSISWKTVSPPPHDIVEDVNRSEQAESTEQSEWDVRFQKKQCPNCSALHEQSASDCGVCGWTPEE